MQSLRMSINELNHKSGHNVEKLSIYNVANNYIEML